MLIKSKIFLNSYKKYLITILILLITIPSFYHAYKAYERNQSEKIIENYSQAMMLFKNENLDESSTIFAKLLEETDGFIIVSSLNQLVEINIKQRHI